MPDKVYCIYYWDHNGDPNEVELDSVWSSESDALARMKIIEDFEDGYAKYKISKDGVQPSKEVHAKLWKSPLGVDGTVIRWELPDGNFIPTKGYFCREIRFNDNVLLLKPVLR